MVARWAHQREGGLALQGQLGGADGPACGKRSRLKVTALSNSIDMLFSVHSADVLQAARLRLYKLITGIS